MQAPSISLIPFGGGDAKRKSTDSAGSKSPRNSGILPFSLPFVIGSTEQPSSARGEVAGQDATGTDGTDGTAKPQRPQSLRYFREGKTHSESVSVEFQLKQTQLENTLSDTMVEMVHLQEQLAKVHNKLQASNEHIEEHVIRENVLGASVESLEQVLEAVSQNMGRLDIEELVGYRSYAQKHEKEIRARMEELQDLNDRQNVVIKDQASEIAWLKNELELRTADLEVAMEDLKESANREWKKHRSLCLEIGGVYVDFNHQEGIGLTMHKSSKYGPDALGMAGVGIKLGNTFPFEVLGVHPGSRTTDGLPAIFHEGDKIVAIDDVNLETLTKVDVNGLVVGPAGSAVCFKVQRGLEFPKTLVAVECKRMDLDGRIELRPPRRANRKVSSYAKYVMQREYEFHLPPTGTDLVGDMDVWEVLLLEGKPVEDHPTAFKFGDKMLHQPTFLQGSDNGHGVPLCCVWDVDNGDVYYRGPAGPPLDHEKILQRREEQRIAEEEKQRAAEQNRIKIAETQARLRAEVEMRAKLEAEAKLKLKAETDMKEELLQKARADIEKRILASGPLPVLESRPSIEVGDGPFKTFMDSFEPQKKTSAQQSAGKANEAVAKSTNHQSSTSAAPAPVQAEKEEIIAGNDKGLEPANVDAPSSDVAEETAGEGDKKSEEPAGGSEKRSSWLGTISKVTNMLPMMSPKSKQAEANENEDTAKDVTNNAPAKAAEEALAVEAKEQVNLTAEELALEEEIARLAAEEAAKRAAEQLGRLKDAKAAAEAAVAPEEEQAEEDEPSRGAGGETSGRTASKSPGRNKKNKKKK